MTTLQQKIADMEAALADFQALPLAKANPAAAPREHRKFDRLFCKVARLQEAWTLHEFDERLAKSLESGTALETARIEAARNSLSIAKTWTGHRAGV
jgi:hypothetical protein